MTLKSLCIADIQTYFNKQARTSIKTKRIHKSCITKGDLSQVTGVLYFFI